MKYLSYIKYLFLAISVVIMALFAAGIGDGVDYMLYWAYVLLGLCIAAVIILPLMQVIENPKGAVGSLLGFAAVAVVVGVSYALSTDVPVVNSAGGMFENPFELRLSDTGLYTTYFTLAATILVSVGGEVRNMLK